MPLRYQRGNCSPEECFQSGKSFFLSQLAPAASCTRRHEREFITPVKLAFRCDWECVCVCVFAGVLCETDKEKRERKRARLIITSAVTDSEFTRHSDNQCLHASAMFRKARGSFWVHIQHVSFHLVPTGDVTVDRSRGLGVTVWLELDRVTKNPPKCIRLGFFFI